MVELDDKKLLRLVRMLKEKLPSVKVGVLDDRNARKEDDGYNNAGIGAKHEFGLFAPELKQRMPVRSFLRMPLATRYQYKVARNLKLDMDRFKEMVNAGSFEWMIAKLGFVAETVIDDAFETGGFGTWKPSAMEFKTNHQTLVETVQLRRSIMSKVVK